MDSLTGVETEQTVGEDGAIRGGSVGQTHANSLLQEHSLRTWLALALALVAITCNTQGRAAVVR